MVPAIKSPPWALFGAPSPKTRPFRRIHWRRPWFDRLTTRALPCMTRLQAAIDEAHRLGKKTGCPNYGGEGLRNAIVAGCDTIEHGFGLDQEEINMMAAKKLYYDPPLVRYTEPYMD